MTPASGTPRSWQQFRRLQHGSARRFLTTLSASADGDPMPFVIWATVLALTPPLLVATRAAFMLSATGDAPAEVILRFVLAFRVFFLAYAMLLALLATALIWEALLPSRADQDILGVLPVHPMVLAGSRLAAGLQVVLVMSLALAVPVALLFGGASATVPRVGSLPRVLFAHVIATAAAASAVFFTMAATRAAIAAVGGDRAAERIGSMLQLVTVLAFVESFLFLPGILGELFRAVERGAAVPIWYEPPLWFAAVYGWIAEGGATDARVQAGLLAVLLPGMATLALTLLPAGAIARRVQETLSGDRAALVTTTVRHAMTLLSPRTSVRGLAMFAAATLSRSRRHAVILASYAGLALAMAVVEMVTASFADRFSTAVPRQDNLALPLVCLFFAVIGLRTAMSRPADAAANWPFLVASPQLRECRHAARLIMWLLGVGPILVMTTIGATALWPAAVAVQVVVFDTAAAVLLVELALLGWTLVPCASAHQPGTAGVKSTWPLQMFGLYLFAFRGADLEMLALRSPGGAVVAAALVGVVVGALYLRHRRSSEPAITLEGRPDTYDLALLKLSDVEAQ